MISYVKLSLFVLIGLFSIVYSQQYPMEKKYEVDVPQLLFGRLQDGGTGTGEQVVLDDDQSVQYDDVKREMTVQDLLREMQAARYKRKPYGDLSTGNANPAGEWNNLDNQQRRLKSKRDLRKRQLIYFRQCFFNPISCF